MADIDGAGAIEVILDRMDRLCCSNDYARRELREARQRVRDLESENRDLRAENDLLRRRPAEAAPTAPLTPPYDAISRDETPRARGHKARSAGLTHKVPADLRSDPAAGQEYVDGWISENARPTGPIVPVADDPIPF